MRVRIEITDDRVECKTNGRLSLAISMRDFLDAVGGRLDSSALPEAIPEGTRFIRRRGEAVVMVVEEPPGARTVRWLTAESRIRYGPDASYRSVRLSFPFVILVAVFRRGALTENLQCFYRCAPLTTLADPLLCPNILNVRAKDRLVCWLCLKLQSNLANMSWEDKVRQIRTHLWGSAFNESAGAVYWRTMAGLDPRLATLEAWEQATAVDPFFTLNVSWRSVGLTVDTVMAEMLNAAGHSRVPTSAIELASVAALCPPYAGGGKDAPTARRR